jgi:hypothetical protein
VGYRHLPLSPIGLLVPAHIGYALGVCLKQGAALVTYLFLVQGVGVARAAGFAVQQTLAIRSPQSPQVGQFGNAEVGYAGGVQNWYCSGRLIP